MSRQPIFESQEYTFVETTPTNSDASSIFGLDVAGQYEHSYHRVKKEIMGPKDNKKRNPKNLYLRGNCWYYNFRYEGRRYCGRIGPVKRTTAGYALEKIKTDIREGKFKPNKKKYDSTFQKFSEIYLPSSQNVRDKTSINALLPFFGLKRLPEINPPLIEKYRQVRKETVVPATINLEVKCLGHMFEMAITWDYAEANPVKKIKMLKVSNQRYRILSYQEELDLYEAIDSNPKARHIKPIVVLALQTAMRLGELLNLTWDQIDFNNRILTILKTKNGKVRKLKLTLTALETLLNIKKGNHDDQHLSQYIFPNLKTGAPLVNIRRAFCTAVRRAGISNFRFHDLRHTAATRMNLGNTDLPSIQEILGHADVRTTRRYAHPTQESMGRGMEVLDWQRNKVTTILTTKEGEAQQRENVDSVSAGYSEGIHGRP